MSITLDYTTIDPVAVVAFHKMQADAGILLRKHDWWAEPLNITRNAKSKKVVGSTRIFLGSYTTNEGRWVKVTEDEDYLLACTDSKVIVKQLEVWSKQHATSWLVEIGGDKIGRIEGGIASQEVQEFVSGLCAASKLPESVVPELLRKFESRRDPEPPSQQHNQPTKQRAWWQFWVRNEA